MKFNQWQKLIGYLPFHTPALKKGVALRILLLTGVAGQDWKHICRSTVLSGAPAFLKTQSTSELGVSTALAAFPASAAASVLVGFPQ